MQNAGIAAIAKDWRYLAFDVHPDELRQTIDGGAKAMKFIGLNLTVPTNYFAVEMMDAIDPRAKKWGAVNTVVFETRVSDNWVLLGTLKDFDAGEVRTSNT